MKTTADLATILAATVAAQTAEVAMETVEYKGWKNNLKLANKQMELIVTLDIGPRVIFLGPIGGENVFKNYDPQIGKCIEVDRLPAQRAAFRQDNRTQTRRGASRQRLQLRDVHQPGHAGGGNTRPRRRPCAGQVGGAC